MSNNLIIIGASGFGKEVVWLAKRLNITILGFLDDDKFLVGKSFYGYPVLGETHDWINYKDESFIIAVGAPRVRKLIVEKMNLLGKPNFTTLIDPNVVLDLDEINLGVGCIICAGTICTADVSIGSYSIINKNCSIGHDVTINNFCSVSPNVMIGGHVELKDGVEVGAGSSVRQDLNIDQGALIGMGSVVVKSLESNSLYFGIPAKKIKNILPF